MYTVNNSTAFINGLLKNRDIAHKIYLSLYKAYDLGRAVKDFKSDINNLSEVVEYGDL